MGLGDGRLSVSLYPTSEEMSHDYLQIEIGSCKSVRYYSLLE